jgi:hypothetical protein
MVGHREPSNTSDGGSPGYGDQAGGQRAVHSPTRALLALMLVAVAPLTSLAATPPAPGGTRPEVCDTRATAATGPAGAPSCVAPAAAAAASPMPDLAGQRQTIAELATKVGDRTYLMLDKSRGELLLFLDGRPVFAGAALTGQSPGDVIPSYVFDKAFGGGTKLEEKVTPAGRFTVKRESDPHYGTIFTINEIEGKDWDIAIHRVALVPGENRPERLRSQNAADRHITNGCINVERDTIRFLERNVFGPRTPIYILPNNTSRTLTFFSTATTAH